MTILQRRNAVFIANVLLLVAAVALAVLFAVSCAPSFSTEGERAAQDFVQPTKCVEGYTVVKYAQNGVGAITLRLADNTEVIMEDARLNRRYRLGTTDCGVAYVFRL